MTDELNEGERERERLSLPLLCYVSKKETRRERIDKCQMLNDQPRVREREVFLWPTFDDEDRIKRPLRFLRRRVKTKFTLLSLSV